jgi:IMP dehydrogenase/GMP reductase
MKFDFDDILIKPAVLTDINSRSEVDVTNNDDMLPLFTAPMDTVVCDENVDYFVNAGITTILPRKQNIDSTYVSTNKNCWYAYGLKEFRDVFLLNTPDNRGANMYALIDVANGHMPALKTALIEAKQKYGGELVVMVGNIANPYTYVELSNAGADYIRIGIGNGGGCLTTQQTGIGYPMASLIIETRKLSRDLVNPAKIVADGGFKKYADIIKALALGADYVMLGSILNKALESAGETTNEQGDIINQYSEIAKNYFDVDIPLYKTFRGMSTKEVQSDWGKDTIKTSEGVVRKHVVEYTVSGWVDNFTHYLKSAMSYTDCTNLNSFIGGVEYIEITENSFKRYNK